MLEFELVAAAIVLLFICAAVSGRNAGTSGRRPKLR